MLPKSDTSLTKRITEEVAGKIDTYESRMSTYMASIGEWDDLFRVRRPKRKKNTFSNPRLTEFHRAGITLGTLTYRMQTAKDPFFSVTPMDLPQDPFDPLHPYFSYEAGQTIQHAVGAQLRAAKYKQQLLKASLFCAPFGTVVCQEDYRVVGVNSKGRRIPVTDFVPRMMDQVAFDQGTTDIATADWISTMDVVSDGSLRRMLAEIEEIGAPWNKQALESAIALQEKSNTINAFVLNRLRRSSFGAEDAFAGKKELALYFGKLDTLNDGLEYVCALVNRKMLVRFHANNFQSGKRNFRIAKWIDWAGPLGLGIGDTLGSYHKSMDANRQKIIDKITFGVYNMHKVRKNAISIDEMTIRPLKFFEVEDPGDITPFDTESHSTMAAMKLEDAFRAEFRATSGATDTLQATVTEATASEVSLASNEAMRRISVAAEMMAEPLVREHLEVTHANNGEYVHEPFNVNRAGIAQAVYPSDLRLDVDFELLLTTDKDFKPQRLEKALQGLQIITSTKSIMPGGNERAIMALQNEILYMLDVPVSKWGGGQGAMMPQGPMAAPPIDPLAMAALGMGGIEAGSGVEVLNTPVGPTLGSSR